MVYKVKDCHLKNQQESGTTIPDTTKTQVNPNCHANSTTFSNASKQSWQNCSWKKSDLHYLLCQ